VKIILRQVFIYKDDGLIYKMQFGKALTNEDFDNLYHKIKKDAYAVLGDRVQYYDYYKYRISYITSKELNLIFFFVTGLTDSFKDIKTELYRCKNEFLNLFEGVLDHHFDAKTLI
jgi:hypothetical protein